MDEDAGNDHDAVVEFATYEDFLDSQISTLDLYYLEVRAADAFERAIRLDIRNAVLIIYWCD